MSARLTLDERSELDRLRRVAREQAEELQAYREARYSGAPDYARLMQQLRLRPSEGMLLAEMFARFPDPVSKERLLDAMAPARIDRNHEPEIQIVAVHLSHVRKRFRALGFPDAIVNHWGFGWSLSPEVAAFLRPQAQAEAA